MKMKTRYRLLGGVIILAVLAIVLPRLWEDTARSRSTQLSFAIPKPPSEDAVPVLMPKQPADAVQDNDSDSSSFTVTDNSPAKAATAQTQAPQLAQVAKAKPAISKSGADKAAPAAIKPAPKDVVAAKTIAKPKSQAVVASAKRAVDLKNKHMANQLLQKDLPTAWVIQLGTFSNEQNAQKLIARLRKDGLAAYQREFKRGSKQMVQIFVGPEIQKDKMQKLQQTLRQKYNLVGLLRRYSV